MIRREICPIPGDTIEYGDENYPGISTCCKMQVCLGNYFTGLLIIEFTVAWMIITIEVIMLYHKERSFGQN